MDIYQQLFENNKKWAQNKLENDPIYFEELVKQQHPNFLFIGCSDSRVPADLITGTKPGEMFVHRNIANIVIHTDLNVMSVLQYSVEVLKVEHIIVCGHYGCGGVKAAIDGHFHGLIDKWLRNIKDVYRLYYDELEAITDKEDKNRRLVELSVREQVYHIEETSIIQRARETGQKIEIHGWVYDLANLLIKDLEIDFNKDYKYSRLYKLKD